MFYLKEVEDHVRVEPKHFGLPTKQAVEKPFDERVLIDLAKLLLEAFPDNVPVLFIET